jgi:hypothetical protein
MTSKNDQPITQQDVLNEASKLAAVLKLCSLEFLMTYDGQKAFSLAQGQ